MRSWILCSWRVVLLFSATSCLICSADVALISSQVTSILQEAREALQAAALPDLDETAWQDLTETASTMMEQEETSSSQHDVLQETLERVLDQYHQQQWQTLGEALLMAVSHEMEYRAQWDAALNDSISLSEAEELLHPSRTLSESEAKLEAWVRSIMDEELMSFYEQAQDRLLRAAQAESGAELEASDDPAATASHCIPADVAAQQVQQALVRFKVDGIGMPDEAQDLGATVVHQHTSPTYVPPATTRPVSSTFWSKYIPEDWEDLLPAGWQDTLIPEQVVPASVFHTLGRTGADTAPVETILDANTHPGSCWPMKGSSGYVTLRFPQPLSVTAVTLDHASALLLEDRTSAPKRARVWGYAPCDGRDCKGMGFDISDRFLLAEMEYDLAGPSVQTFGISSDAGVDSGSCSATTMTCGPGEPEAEESSEPPKFDLSSEQVAGIRLEILDNHGNDDYTCLYRFRVHGEVMQ